MEYPDKYSLLEYSDTSAMPGYSATADQEEDRSPDPSYSPKSSPSLISSGGAFAKALSIRAMEEAATGRPESAALKFTRSGSK